MSQELFGPDLKGRQESGHHERVGAGLLGQAELHALIVCAVGVGPGRDADRIFCRATEFTYPSDGEEDARVS
ncbi:hypothetical protein ACFOY2_43695 [Nonomuraea purpurea]|uniref:Uncharacterized protein n=1 Tax=Nonomuraea purpurea TaxID=1849276 RepID=A0ABV8GML8_9ACTN